MHTLTQLQAACGYASEVISLVPDSDLVSKATARPQSMPTAKSGMYIIIILILQLSVSE